MANLTERNGFVLSCEPSLNAHKFIFPFFSSVWICFVMCLFILVCFFSFNFPSWYQFIFVSFNCWKFNFTYFYLTIMIIIRCFGMFRNVSGCSMFPVLSTAVCVIWRSRRLRQVTQTRGFDNSWYHAKTEFNSCFIIHFSHNSSSETEAKRSAILFLRRTRQGA